MIVNTKWITIHPYFQVEEGKLEEFKAIWKEIAPTVQQTESKCVFYEFSFNGHVAFCREGYEDAEGVLAHLGNVGASLEKAATVSKIIKLEVHGPKDEIDKLREPLGHLPVEYFEVEFGFRR